jgi:hypothetical protein
MKTKLLRGLMAAGVLAGCGEEDGRSERETHGNLQADPNFDGSQEKHIPGSRHPLSADPKPKP